MTVYKVVRKSGDGYVSAIVEEPKIRQFYQIGKWTAANARAADLGLGLMCFKTLEQAHEFIRNNAMLGMVVLECEALIELKLPLLRLYFRDRWKETDRSYPKTYDGIIGFYTHVRAAGTVYFLYERWYQRYRYAFEPGWPFGTVSFMKIKPIKEVQG